MGCYPPGAAPLRPLRHGTKQVCMSDTDHEMLRISSEDMSLGCAVFGSAKTDLRKPRNAFLCKRRTASCGALAQEPENANFQNRPQKCLEGPNRTKISRRFQIRFVLGASLPASGRIFAPKIALLLIPPPPYKSVCRGYTLG